MRLLTGMPTMPRPGVHYDPYDLSQVFVRTQDGWVTVPWTHLPMVSAPFADFTWRHARRQAAQSGLDDTNETDVARVLDELLSRAEAGPLADTKTARVAARTRVGAAWGYATGGDLTELDPPLKPNGRHQVHHLTVLLEEPFRVTQILHQPQPRFVWHCSVHNHPDDPHTV